MTDFVCQNCGKSFKLWIYSACPECRFHSTHKGLQGAWRRGYEAAKADKAQSSCPYGDLRGNYHNNVTFSRAYMNAWNDGFKWGAFENV